MISQVFFKGQVPAKGLTLFIRNDGTVVKTVGKA